MMKKFVVFSVLCFVLFSVSATLAQQKIGYFDLNYVLPQLPDFKVAQSELQSYQNKLEEDFKAKQQELQAKYQKYLNEGASMPEPTRQALEKELGSLQEQLQEFQSSAAESIQKKENALLAPIYKKIEEAIVAVAKENGYTYILRREALLYEPEDGAGDISDLVLKKLGVSSVKSK
ncbi:outer membrane protein [Thermonema lapsum]|uniref:Outer membrane protein n=1 Tax=Thermonema lapsum TaxID=28195 RepID=A0A846MQI9_9BACT|nr:OmpH family outer membrane protein [Thermonema lapsum]NIK73836.1 outer membrane protein [Thermonema lapsum]